MTREILEPVDRRLWSTFTIVGEVVGNWCWCPYRGVDEQTLFLWLERADVEIDSQWYACLIREELKRRRGTWQWWV